jgi:hypothetical protein
MRSNIAPDVLYRHIRKQRKNKPSVLDKMTHEEHLSLNTLINRKYDNIDFTTLYKLMRSFSLLDDPTQGWGKQPTNADVTISDDAGAILLRIVSLRMFGKISTATRLSRA